MLKMGIRAEGIQELFSTGIPDFTGDFSSIDFQSIAKLVGI